MDSYNQGLNTTKGTTRFCDVTAGYSSLNELGIIVKVVAECGMASRTSNTFVVSSFHFAVCHQVLSLFVMQQKMILYLAGYSTP